MNHSNALCVLIACVAMATSPAHAQTSERQQEALDAYLPYAGEAVDRFQFFNLIKWELVGREKVIVWPRLNQAYLLTVDKPCMDLEWAKSIGLTSSARTVSARFDSVKAGKDSCRINEIRPIDIKKYQQDREGAKSE